MLRAKRTKSAFMRDIILFSQGNILGKIESLFLSVT
jgi:hypothetical protein